LPEQRRFLCLKKFWAGLFLICGVIFVLCGVAAVLGGADFSALLTLLGLGTMLVSIGWGMRGNQDS